MFNIRGGVIEIVRPTGTVTRIEPISGLSVTQGIGESLAIYEAKASTHLDRLFKDGLEVYRRRIERNAMRR